MYIYIHIHIEGSRDVVYAQARRSRHYSRRRVSDAYARATMQISTNHLALINKMNKSCLTCESMIYVTHMDESCHTYEWVTSHILSIHRADRSMSHGDTSHAAGTNASRHAHEGVVHVTHMNTDYRILLFTTERESYYWCVNESYYWCVNESSWIVHVTIWMSQVTHMKESCHICKWVMSQVWMSL